MSSGNLTSVFAYEVAPRQLVPFAGGQITATSQLQAALDQIFDRSKITTAPVVTFEVDTAPNSRAHPIRDAAIALAFTAGPHEATVVAVASRLAESMDNRSKPSLLMVSVHECGLPSEKTCGDLDLPPTAGLQFERVRWHRQS